VATDALSAAITNSLSIDVMAAATHPYRVPLREGDPLYPPLSERLPVQGLGTIVGDWRAGLLAKGDSGVSIGAACPPLRRAMPWAR
jgi:hypothetical protein